MYLISLAGSLISVFGSAGMLMFFVPLCLAAGCGSSSGGPSGPGPGPESGFVIERGVRFGRLSWQLPLT